MATTKAKPTKKKTQKQGVSSKSKSVDTVEAKTTKKAEKKENKEVAEVKKAETTKEVIVSQPKVSENPAKKFFARKGDPDENIITIFKDTRIIGAIIAEILGTSVVTMIVLTLGLTNPLYTIMAYIGVSAAIFKLSGAHMNPIITAGAMASRRVSAIRGVLYIISQVIGAWLGFTIINGFYGAGLNSGNITADSVSMPGLTAIDSITGASTEDGGFSWFWPITMIEVMGAIMIAFCYTRALSCKKSPLTFAVIASTGLFVATLIAVLVGQSYMGLYSSGETFFVMNPAIALVYGVLPSAAEGFDALMKALTPMAMIYVFWPMIGGIIGAYLADFTAMLSEQKLD